MRRLGRSRQIAKATCQNKQPFLGKIEVAGIVFPDGKGECDTAKRELATRL
jgi:hypothetical protein